MRFAHRVNEHVFSPAFCKYFCDWITLSSLFSYPREKETFQEHATCGAGYDRNRCDNAGSDKLESVDSATVKAQERSG
jgi:hypothetical protein